MAEEEKKKTVEEQIREELEINQGDLIRELTNQPAKFYYWGALWAAASRAKRNQRLMKQEVEARLTKEFRELMAETKPTERVTENMIKMYLNGHPEMIDSEKELVRREYTEDLLAMAKDAMKERHQILLEISRRNLEEQFYGDEYKAMREELEARNVVKHKKRTKRGSEEETPEGE